MSKKISLGIDFSIENSQIAYVAGESSPQSVCFGTEDNFFIPTAVCYNEELKEWSSGQEALNKMAEENSNLKKYTRLPELINNKQADNIEEIIYNYFSYLINMGQKFSLEGKINYLVITVDEVTPQIIEVLNNVLTLMGYKEEYIKILSYSESFVYYVLNQNKDIWINNVYFLHLDNEGFTVRKLNVVKGSQPYVADVSTDNITELVNMNILKQDPQKADEELVNYMEKRLEEDIVSGMYLSGEGFYEEGWNKTLSVICENRRVFKGNNLVVKGAGYSAREFFYTPTLSQYLISCKGRTRVKINMAIKNKERESAITLSNIGTYWYLARTSLECILEKPSEVVFEIQDIMNHKNETFTVDLTKFPERPPKTTRLQVDFRYTEENKIQIKIRDLGFGEFFKTSDIAVTKEVTLN